ncbi:hypothetical protein [Paenibacillus agricola]|uniref:Uncharacterized protein n=1 Tax=Paenibacillus agricola TaxID=2716264 RepID=A0ABX0J4A3_9BACL|nr:hypothetical protein [Paenibacillus agricola]NHN30241.1 hypothetical protein [Paenibacillus agricola]
MKNVLKYLTVSTMLWACLLGMSSLAFADAEMDFEVTSVAYEGGELTAVGVFHNSGDKHISEVTKVNVKIVLHNDEGDSAEVANHDFSNLKVDILPGESAEYTLTFSGVAEYTDATQWTAEEGDWEITYFDDAAEATEEMANEDIPTVEEFVDAVVEEAEAAIDAAVADAEAAIDAAVEAGDEAAIEAALAEAEVAIDAAVAEAEAAIEDVEIIE